MVTLVGSGDWRAGDFKRAVEACGTVEASNGPERRGGQVQRVSAFVISRLGKKKEIIAPSPPLGRSLQHFQLHVSRKQANTKDCLHRVSFATGLGDRVIFYV